MIIKEIDISLNAQPLALRFKVKVINVIITSSAKFSDVVKKNTWWVMGHINAIIMECKTLV